MVFFVVVHGYEGREYVLIHYHVAQMIDGSQRSFHTSASVGLAVVVLLVVRSWLLRLKVCP
jgi:hypothetical protein